MAKINTSELLRKLVAELRPGYDQEAQSIAMILLEDIFRLSRNEIIMNQKVDLDDATQRVIDHYMKQLQADTPIQHVVGWAEFYGYRFAVNKEVLIPRQETEELVHQVSELISKKAYNSILDIGTGSGCIAISLALENKGIQVTAVDVSTRALSMARENARHLKAEVNFLELDILQETMERNFDVIVSNPPYIMNSERASLPANVLNHDPDLALFVPDEDPLLYYQRITELASNHLHRDGLLFFEINEKFGHEIVQLLKTNDFTSVTLLNDLNGKPRFVSGIKK